MQANKVGYCHYHKYPLTARQMRLHGCLHKKGAWCKRFEPNLEHQWWISRLNRGRSKRMAEPFKNKGLGVLAENESVDN